MQIQSWFQYKKTIYVTAAFLAMLCTAGTLLAQQHDTPQPSTIVDGVHISSAIAYAAISVFGGVGTALITVIKLMWNRLDDQAKEFHKTTHQLSITHQSAIDKQREDNQAAIDKQRVDYQAAMTKNREDSQKMLDECRRECRAEIDAVRSRLEEEQEQRRNEQDKLHRENQTILREVMQTCVAVEQALRKSVECSERLLLNMHKKGEM